MSFVPTETLEKALLTDGTTTVTSGDFAGILTAAKVGLVGGPMVPTAKTVYSDIVQPAYSGYAEQNAVIGTPFRRGEGGIAVESAQLHYQLSGGSTGGLVYGAYLTDGGVTPKLLGVEMFDDPFTFVDALDRLYATMQVAVGGPDFGVGEYSN